MKHPPRIAEWILERSFRQEETSHRLGDFEEVFQYKAEHESVFVASKWFWAQTLKSLPQLLHNSVYWSLMMLKNYLKLAFRNIRKQKGYSFINISGLAVGIASCLLIFMYVNQELSYDTFHKDSNRVFRVVEEIESKTAQRNFAPIAWPVAPALKDKFPQVEFTARIYTFLRPRLIKYQDKRFFEESYMYAENNFFKILTFPFIAGNPGSALSKPETIVISERMAKKYFGENYALGKTLNINDRDFEITGVMQDFPQNTHLKYDFIASMKTIENDGWMSNWWGTECYTYIKLKPNVDSDLFQQQMLHIADDYVGEEIKVKEKSYRFPLQAVSDIHLHSNLRYEIEAPGSIISIVMFSIIGIMILIIAAINFVNLATARSLNRAREVGLRKVVGGIRGQIISQFLAESMLVTLLALIAGLGITVLVLPYFNTLANTTFTISYFMQPKILMGLLVLLLVVGLGAGSYPALFLSNFKAVTTLKGTFKTGSKGSRLRKILVVGQFAISLILIVSTIVIFQQLDFMKNRHLGFDKEQKLIIPVKGGADISTNPEMIKNEFGKILGIKATTASSTVPGRGVGNYGIELKGKDDNKSQSMFHMYFDSDFIKAYQIEILAGRSFNSKITSDRSEKNNTSGGFLVNEAAAKSLGCGTAQEAVGLVISTGMGGRPGPVLGVTKDFHYRGLQNKVEPLVMEWYPEMFDHLTLLMDINNLSQTLPIIEQTWSQFFPEIPLESFFLDADFNRQYRADEQLGKITGLFTLLGIIIACMGLIGLVSFAAEQRTKEIGIRKVLGATAVKIVFLLSFDFGKWIIISNLIAWPLAWIIMDRWLQNFAYRADITIIPFLAASVLIFILAISSISYQAIKASIANPINALKYE